jgi:hypothetical protein
VKRVVQLALVIVVVASVGLREGRGQGETTSAIVGEVKDATNAVVPGATVTITSRETGLKRSAQADGAGRFNFPQLKPGTYSVKVDAQGFEPQQNDNVVAGLGEKQTVDFTLKLARSIETVEVNSDAPLIGPEIRFWEVCGRSIVTLGCAPNYGFPECFTGCEECNDCTACKPTAPKKVEGPPSSGGPHVRNQLARLNDGRLQDLRK